MTEPQSLKDTLEATAAGDRAAFSRLYALSSPQLFAVVLRIVRRHDWAEDILQEAYLRIWDHAADYRPEKGAPMTWLISIARHRAIDWRRRDRGESALDDIPGSAIPADPDPSPLDWAIAGERGRALKDCLDELEPKQRDCILLAYGEGQSHSELAARLGSPIGSVKSWIRRAQHHLKDCIERWQTSSTT